MYLKIITLNSIQILYLFLIDRCEEIEWEHEHTATDYSHHIPTADWETASESGQSNTKNPDHSPTRARPNISLRSQTSGKLGANFNLVHIINFTPAYPNQTYHHTDACSQNLMTI